MKLKKLTLTLMMMGAALPAFADFTIQDIRVEGLQHTEPATVFTHLPVRVGDQFNDASGGEIIRNLYATGFFEDVRVESLGNQVLLTVVERPVVGSVNVTGGKLLPDDVVKKNLAAFGLGQAQPFDPNKLSEAVAALKEEYKNQGKYAATITPQVNKLANNRIAIDLKIDEGETTTISDINFEGNTVYSDRQLRNKMGLSENGMWTWFTKANRFNSDKFNQDLEKISAFYHNNGYFDFQIVDTKVDRQEDKFNQTIDITVSEGERYRWGKVSIAGDTKEVSPESLNEFLTMKEGKWYDRSQMMAALEKIQHSMQSAGYAYSEVNVIPQPNRETHVVDFVLAVTPGNKIYVNKINISGNNKTRDEVVRRELRQMEAAPYDISKLQRSKQRVELLGYFDGVEFEQRPLKGLPDQVDLDMRVQERSTGSLNFSAGWVQDSGLVLSAGVAQDNLFGSGKSVSAQVSRSKTTRNASLSFTDPYFTPDGVSLGYDVYARSYDPRQESTAYQYKTSNVGLGVRTGVPVTEYDRVNFGLAADYMTVHTYPNAPKRYRDFMTKYGKLTDDQGSGTFKGWNLKGTIGWGRNTTDSAIWPTRGYVISANLEAGLPSSKLQYYSLTHDQRWFFPLSQDFTLMLAGSLGYANGYGKTKELPFFENFYGGGLGSVRGYESGSLGPKVYDRGGSRINYGGNHMATGTAELLFPFPGLKDNRALRLSLFADAGSIWDGQKYDDSSSELREGSLQNVYGIGNTHHSSFKNELRYSAGAALTWLSPVGPMKLSYAYPLKKKATDELQRFQFQLGTTF
ncbi:MAG: outer membrane protein assembly factor BamA [Neisseria sp.]|nr:outer membrane protein assembly factor BamA [Neisseria sp.]